MRKVLLVIDEIQQLVGLEAFLRRLGFDVLSLGKDSLVTEALLSFQPEIVIATHRGRQVDGLKLAARLKKAVVPSPRIAISYTGAQPALTKDDERSIDALIEIPAAGESAIRLMAQLSGLPIEPLLEKYRKVASARLTKDEQIVIIAGAAPSAPMPSAISAGPSSAAWDPAKNPGRAAEMKTDRSTGYDQFLENHSKDLANGAADKVLPRERAGQFMAKLKEDSKNEKQKLEEIQAQKIKFAEAMFNESSAAPKRGQTKE
jgi:CheY-like chemotaxis protein